MKLTDEQLMSIMPEDERKIYASMPPEHRRVKLMGMEAEMPRIIAVIQCAKILDESGLSVGAAEGVLETLKARIRARSVAEAVKSGDAERAALIKAYQDLRGSPTEEVIEADGEEDS